jgi:hypothetical protein
VAKKKAFEGKVDQGILKERQLLAALDGFSGCLAKVLSTYQDDRIGKISSSP